MLKDIDIGHDQVIVQPTLSSAKKEEVQMIDMIDVITTREPSSFRRQNKCLFTNTNTGTYNIYQIQVSLYCVLETYPAADWFFVVF